MLARAALSPYLSPIMFPLLAAKRRLIILASNNPDG